MSKIGKSCVIFKDILGMHMEEEKALAIHDVMEMPTHNGFTKAEMLNVIKWLWHQKYRLDDEPMTNADRIRNMTDEELYKFLRFFGVCRICKHRKDEGCDNRGCTQEEVDVFFKEWLQAEVKEGAENG